MAFAVIFVLFLAGTAYGNMHCTYPGPELPNDWIDMVPTCVNALRGQIQEEVKASFAYLSMGAYFSRDTVNRPGFAEYFFKAAKEEREHATKLIEYLLMRGELVDSVTNLITIPVVQKHVWKDGVSALTYALNLETNVTQSIRDVIITCEKGKPLDKFNDKFNEKSNDYHLVDYLSGVYLEEQYKSQRELAGMLSTLTKMMKNNGPLGEFLFDKTLLE